MTNLQASRVYRLLVLISSIAILLAIGAPSRAQALKGVNLAGAAFAPSRLPGVYGYDYIYPNDKEIDYFVGKGMNVFRISILWERIQPVPDGPLDPQELARLKSFVAYANQRDATVIIDLHNYGRYRGGAIGDGAVTDAMFSDVWRRLATVFKNDDKVAFGLMNEPQLSSAETWRSAVQAAITAIRMTGARNMILVSGIQWDSAAGFAQVSGDSLGTLIDPQHRLVFEVHEYFDGDSSGTSASCIDPDQAVGRLTSFTQWLRTSKNQGFFGEFAVSRQPECLPVLARVAAYLHANADVWLGWTYWAAGPEWGDYMFSLEPVDGVDRPQMRVLQPFLAAHN